MTFFLSEFSLTWNVQIRGQSIIKLLVNSHVWILAIDGEDNTRSKSDICYTSRNFFFVHLILRLEAMNHFIHKTAFPSRVVIFLMNKYFVVSFAKLNQKGNIYYWKVAKCLLLNSSMTIKHWYPKLIKIYYQFSLAIKNIS